LRLNAGLVADVVENSLRNANSARRSQFVNPRRDINAVTQHSVVGEHYVANVNPDPDPQFTVAGERGLDFTCATNRIESAVEARKGTVADLADLPSVETRQDAAQQLAMRRQRAHC